MEQALYLENIGAAVKVGPQQLPTLHKLLSEACACLNMEAPALYVRQVRPLHKWTPTAVNNLHQTWCLLSRQQFDSSVSMSA